MNISALFIRRPVATTLLTIGVVLAGIISVRLLPVSPLPRVEFPTIMVSANLPGAEPETMASSVAAPLERQFGVISGITEITSTSTLGGTSIVLQFDLTRDIDGAARDVQAAINAARSYLPANLPSNPTYRKVNPAEAPILIIALTSDTVTTARIYDAASSILQQKLSQVKGVGQVIVGGGSLPAVRVEMNPTQLNSYGVSLETVRSVLAAASVDVPKGQFSNNEKSWQIDTNDQLYNAAEYAPVYVSYNSATGQGVKLTDVATVRDSVEDVRAEGLVNGKPAVMVIIFREPAANIIGTVDRVYALLPQLAAALPGGIDLSVMLDRTPPIRGSLADVEFTLVLSAALVILVVFAFLRNVRSTAIPAVAVAVSLIGAFGVMYLCGYSIDNLSLMALTIATGFVVDDAIVVLENITRHVEAGMPPLEAALTGGREISFTVISMSVSLVAVFIPILLMGGMVGRLFREFAVTLSAAVAVSLVVSLTTTPMMSARLIRPLQPGRRRRIYQMSEAVFNGMHGLYDRSLRWWLKHPILMLLPTIIAVALTIYLFSVIPKGFFPEQDTGRLLGIVQADQDISFQAMRLKLTEVVDAIKSDRDVESVAAFTGSSSGSPVNTARMFVALKPFAARQASADQIIGRLRGKLAAISGAPTYLQPVQDLRVGGRLSAALYQYTLQGREVTELNRWGRRVLARVGTLPQLRDVSSDQQDKGLQASVVIDRDAASRFGITPSLIDQTLYDAFGQRQASILYTMLNQYHLVMEAAPKFWQRPETLRDIYLPSTATTVSTAVGATTSANAITTAAASAAPALTAATPTVGVTAAASGTIAATAATVTAPTTGMVPLSAFTRFVRTQAPLAVNHQGQFPAVTLSFNLAPGISLGEAVSAVNGATREMGMPASIAGSFQGTAEAFIASLSNEPLLILAALVAVYIVLGILYESYVHPITILSTLPSAGVGALLALLIFHQELSVIAVIGIVLLIGIVKKNGIMMVDFALEAERTEGKKPMEAIYEASLLRFRPIMMTTMAALFGALPLALGRGIGSELRRPLGIAIVGGLVVSQMLTLYSTPVIYLYLDRLRHRKRKMGTSP